MDECENEHQFDNILKSVKQYYTGKIQEFGPTARGVDVNSPESQTVRFTQILRITDPDIFFSINDYGCGYGALVEHLTVCGYKFRYYGYDISDPMIATAIDINRGRDNCVFFSDKTLLRKADYSVASGIFNVKFETPYEEWQQYVLETILKMDEISEKGFSFNILTKYSDKERMRPDLYYADPCFFFDYCKTHFSRNVALLHDYGLYEFTILVRK